MNRIMKSTMKHITVCSLFLSVFIISLAMQKFTAGPAAAATTVPALWTAGGLSAGNDSAGQAARMAVDASGNVAIVSGPADGSLLSITSYKADGVLRWQRTVSANIGTFAGDWVAAAPNGDFVAVGHNVDSHGRPIQSTMVRYATDGTLLWRVDFTSGFFPSVARLLVDAAGNAYVAWSAVGTGFLVQKYSPSGALLWSQGDSTGGGYAIASSLALSPDGTDVTVSGSVSGGALWITAVYNTTTGERRWHVAAAEGIAARDVVVDATRVYVTGQGNEGINGFLTVVAYDRATGARLWRTDANPETCCAIGLRIALAPDGSLVVAGHTATGGYFDWWIVAMENSGTVRWQAVRDAALSGDEFPAAVFVLDDGTTVVSGAGGPVIRDILGNQYMQGVTAGYSSNGTLLWEGISKLATVWAAALPNDDVCATGGYDALITCWRPSGGIQLNQPPTAAMSATPSSGTAPLTVNFSSVGSSDPDGAIASYSWRFGDGGTSTAANPSHTYTSGGAFTAILTVTDNAGASVSKSVTITVTATASVLRSTNITLTAARLGNTVTATGKVTVKNQAGVLFPGATTSATWTLPNGTTKSQTSTTNSSGIATFSVKSNRGTYTLKLTNITKTGYTFDAVNSVLVRSITK